MQLQMEVCDLDECDFVETKFIEYDSEEAYQKDNAKKGVILVFVQEGEYVYRYMPLSVTDYNAWMVEMYESTPLTWVKNIYWKLEVYSCILVKRQREWFQAAVPAFVSIWDTIVRERENGEFVKRAPKKRAKVDAVRPEMVKELLVVKNRVDMECSPLEIPLNCIESSIEPIVETSIDPGIDPVNDSVNELKINHP
jgi:hypothetical protein